MTLPGSWTRPAGQRARLGNNKYLLNELLPNERRGLGFDLLDKLFSNYESRPTTFIEERKIFNVSNFSSS